MRHKNDDDGDENIKERRRRRIEMEMEMKMRMKSTTETTTSAVDKKKKKNKKKRNEKLLKHLSIKATTTTPSKSSSHAFECDPSDHCETPFQAYKDIEPFLFRIAQSLKKTKATLRIYDPYFCEGSTKEHLLRLGFENVTNVNEDFYVNIENKNVPEYDVLLTNPPYSADHFTRILNFCGKSKKPFFLLLPNFVCRKKYYASEIIQKQKEPMFLIPDELKPYRYWAPGRKGFEVRAKGTTPFVTFWYLDFGNLVDLNDVRRWWMKKYSAHSNCQLPAPELALPQQQRLQKRDNPRRRKANNNKESTKDETGTKQPSSIYYDPRVAKKRKQI